MRLGAGGRSWLIAELAGIDISAAQHQSLGLRLVQNDRGGEDLVVVNQAESPLAWLHARGALDSVQFEAGERLRRDYTLAQLEPRLCTDLSAPVVLGGNGPKTMFISDTVLAAKQRLAKALGAVGPGLSDVLFDVCCALKGLETAEKEKSWPRRSGKVVLALALDRLADHYGLRPAAISGRMRSWSADNLEPARPI
ncbi:MAG: DNA replication protein [Alphaproteobacteria bacterium]|nr:DNA replication protein [Alphaproteobacteria bacterium]